MLANNKGWTLISVLMLLFILSLLSITLISIINTHYLLNIAEDNYQQAYNGALSCSVTAYDDVVGIANKVHNDLIMELYSGIDEETSTNLQSYVRTGINNYYKDKLEMALLEAEYILPHSYSKEPVFYSQSNDPMQLDTIIRMTGGNGTNPINISIVSNATINDVKRRVDARIKINKVTRTMDSILFYSPLFLRGIIHIEENGIITAEDSHQMYENLSIHINDTITVPSENTIVNDGVIYLIENENPFIYIQSNSFDISLMSGDYRGILYAKGDIYIPEGEIVSFSGLIIGNGNLIISGQLEITLDQGLISWGLGTIGEPLKRLFHIYEEPSFIEIVSWRERFLYEAY